MSIPCDHTFLLVTRSRSSVKVSVKNQGHSFPKNGLWGGGIRVSQTHILFSFLQLFITSNFSFSHCVFYPYGELFAFVSKSKIVVCKLFQFGRVQNLLFGKGLRDFDPMKNLGLVGGTYFSI